MGAGCLWSTGPLFVKLSIDSATWIVKYLWLRMVTLVVLYTCFITEHRRRCCRSTHPPIDNPQTMLQLLTLQGMPRKWVVTGVLGLSCAMAGFVTSLVFVPAAYTLCELAAAPFFAAVFERLLLGVKISPLTGGCMSVAAVGLVLFALESILSSEGEQGPTKGATGHNGTSPSQSQTALDTGGSSGLVDENMYDPVLGNVLGITSSIGVAIYTVALRIIPIEHGANGLYGLILSMYAAGTVFVGTSLGLVVHTLYTQNAPVKGWSPLNPFGQPGINVLLAMGHAFFIFLGFILYTLGSSHLPAPETVLLSMMEVVLGVLLTYVFVGEYPGYLGIVGTVLTTIAVVVNGIGNGLLEERKSSRGKRGKGGVVEVVEVEVVGVGVEGEVEVVAPEENKGF